MIIKWIPSSDEDTAVHQLPEPDMVVDPTPVYQETFKVKVTVNGTAMTLTRIDRKENERPGWKGRAYFRVYSRNEFHYSFESTKYLYHCIDGERAPRDATEIVVKDGVERIWEYAFRDCRSLSKITIPDTVTSIDKCVFAECIRLRCIQLPPKLQYIGQNAFHACLSLEAIYIPPTVTLISHYTFRSCVSLRIINFPDSVQDIGEKVVGECSALGTDYEAKYYTAYRDDNQWIRNRYNPLHEVCWDPSVTANNIHQYIQNHHDDGEERATTKDKPHFIPLHLLAANPSVTGDMIVAYLQLAPDVATMRDGKDKTPLHMLCSVPSFVDSTGSAIETYLGACNEGKEAAFMTDNEGRTPFDCLCEKNVDELLFLENKSFAGLVVWWYGGMIIVWISAYLRKLLMQKKTDSERF